MSGRQADEMLDDVERRIHANVCYRCEGAKQLSPGYDCFACEGTGMFALSSSFALDIIAELRERRAADLSDEDREALTELVEWAGIAGIWDQWNENDHEQCERARTLLDRLLSRGKDGR